MEHVALPKGIFIFLLWGEVTQGIVPISASASWRRALSEQRVIVDQFLGTYHRLPVKINADWDDHWACISMGTNMWMRMMMLLKKSFWYMFKHFYFCKFIKRVPDFFFNIFYALSFKINSEIGLNTFLMRSAMP
jgi:hypothetical protein